MNLFPFTYKVNIAELLPVEFYQTCLSWLLVDEAWAELKIKYIEQTGDLDGWGEIDESDDYDTSITVEAGPEGDPMQSYFIVTICEREKTDDLP